MAKSDELVFLPLGGSGEIGMNFNAYGFGPAHRRQWIVVDCGTLDWSGRRRRPHLFGDGQRAGGRRAFPPTPAA